MDYDEKERSSPTEEKLRNELYRIVKTRYSVERGIQSAHGTLNCPAKSIIMIFKLGKLATTTTVGSIKTTPRTKILTAEPSLITVSDPYLSQFKTSSRTKSQMKKE